MPDPGAETVKFTTQRNIEDPPKMFQDMSLLFNGSAAEEVFKEDLVYHVSHSVTNAKYPSVACVEGRGNPGNARAWVFVLVSVDLPHVPRTRMGVCRIVRAVPNRPTGSN